MHGVNINLNHTVECLRPNVSAARARVGLFDFDGTISLIRSGWVDIMVPMMVEILLELHTGESEAAFAPWWKILSPPYRRTNDLTDDRDCPPSGVRGGKPLEPLAYKRMYHDKLMANIEYRRQDLRRGAVRPKISGAGSARLSGIPARARPETVLRQRHR